MNFPNFNAVANGRGRNRDMVRKVMERVFDWDLGRESSEKLCADEYRYFSFDFR